MWSILKKEFSQFFSSLTGYVTILLFLLINGLFLFVLNDSSIFEYGYAGMDKFFDLAPWVFMFLVPAITMRVLSDEIRTGTYELLITMPLTPRKIVLGKFIAVVFILILIILPSGMYVYTIKALSSTYTIDVGGIIGSYIGLLMLAITFASIGVACSGSVSNPIVAFLISAFLCLTIYYGFGALGKISVFSGNADYYLDMLGIDFHYRSMSRGVVDTRDLVYFFSVIISSLYITELKLSRR